MSAEFKIQGYFGTATNELIDAEESLCSVALFLWAHRLTDWGRREIPVTPWQGAYHGEKVLGLASAAG